MPQNSPSRSHDEAVGWPLGLVVRIPNSKVVSAVTWNKRASSKGTEMLANELFGYQSPLGLTVGLGGNPPFQLAAAGEPFHVCSPIDSALRVIRTRLALLDRCICTPTGSSDTVRVPATKSVSYDPAWLAWQLPANNPCWGALISSTPHHLSALCPRDRFSAASDSLPRHRQKLATPASGSLSSVPELFSLLRHTLFEPTFPFDSATQVLFPRLPELPVS